MDDIEIPGATDETRNHSPHPWWSRILYLLYGVFAIAGAIFAASEGKTSLAIGAGGIGAVLIWKAAQRVR